MKTFQFLILVLFAAGLNAQVINFPDANFKSRLLSASPANTVAKNLAGNYFKIDANSNGEIEQAEALEVSYLLLLNSSIVSMEGVEYFSNLVRLLCHQNDIVTLDVTDLTSLTHLDCSNNQTITTLNVSGLTNLQSINAALNHIVNLNLNGLTSLQSVYLSGNDLTTLSTEDTPNLQLVFCNSNNLTSLDFSDSPLLNDLRCSDNELQSLFIKNGITENILQLYNNPGLQYICCDEVQIASVQANLAQNGMADCQVNSYCSFEPGGNFYTVRGRSKMDDDNNGCDLLDINYPNLRFSITDGTVTGGLISNTTGNYTIPLQAGTYTITPILENSSYFAISPPVFTASFPTDATPFTQDFCLTPTGLHSDLEVSISPVGPARPGFDARYKVTVKNSGTTTQSGSVSVSFNDAVLDYVSANPAPAQVSESNLIWNINDLYSLEIREIELSLNANSPVETPAVNGGDVFTYTAEVTSSESDETPLNNTFSLSQTVVNSFDPNDKTCLEGTAISSAMVGQYVHYTIRFENTGTFPAENIVVTDVIDTAKFDVASLVPLSGSDPFITRISDMNKVEFIFQNINLPFNDADNDGYVTFKIRTRATLNTGNSFSNSASIYFDYNAPIVTNTATTTISALSVNDFDFDAFFTIHPNPVKDMLNIGLKKEISVSSASIYNPVGQLLSTTVGDKRSIDVSALKPGNYFVKITTSKGTATSQFLKQ